MYQMLIADDEMIERMVLYQTLQKNLEGRCQIFQAENGREAVRIHEEQQIQIAILDIEMPGINGIEAAKKIRETDKDCCIIFLTAFDDFDYARKAIGLRALDYLLKPYDEQELMLVVEEAFKLVNERRKQEKSIPEEAVRPPKEDGNRDADVNFRMAEGAELIQQYIRENYMREISMQDLAKKMNYSEVYFCKLFKQCFHKNFTAYLMEYRVEEARKMLERPTVNVKEVGKAVGYPDSNYFAKVFKRVTGQSPSEYRAELLHMG
ncbi:MAG: response regulator [Lachnospiraceae bacterium]|nr:response regulator [Lachnospiraceae bacterium]